MQAASAGVPQNQIGSAAMSGADLEVETVEAQLGAPSPATGGGAAALVVAMLAGAAAVLAASSYHAPAPLLTTVLGVLAGLGLFFVLGLVAGHVSIAPRVGATDLARVAADSLERGMLVATEDGTPLYVNAALRRMTATAGVPVAGVIERLVGPDPAGQAALFRLNRAASLREAARAEIALQGAPSGGAGLDASTAGTVIVRIAVKPFVVPGHERDLAHRRLVLWTLDDVTEDRLRSARSEARLTADLNEFDAAPVGLALTAADGTIRTINATLATWLGSAARAKGARLADYLPGDGFELVRGALGGSGGGAGRAVTLDLDLCREDGRILPARVVCRASGADGLAVAVLPPDARSMNDTGGPAAPDDRFARFFQAAPFGIATVAADGRIGSPNGAFARMILDGAGGVGRPAIEVLGRDADAETRIAIEAGLKHVLGGRGGVAPIEVPVGSEKKEVRRVYMHPLATAGGGEADALRAGFADAGRDEVRDAAILYVVDATEHKALEAKFAQSSKMEAVGKLAGGIAHDFNNMLTAIIGFSDILLAMHRPTDVAYKDLRNIKSSAERAAGLVGKLLAFSRQQTLLKETLQVGEVLTDLAPLLKRSIGEKIELKMTTGRDLWPVKTDKIQLEQAVINLAVNARDAMPSGGKLAIRSRNVGEREAQKLGPLGMTIGEYVLIEVEDSGTGMSPEIMAKIFEPFFTTKGVGKGTGLGLAELYGFVKQAGGYVFPDSTPGKGTTFRVYLPRHHVDAEEEAQTAKDKAIAVQKSLKPADLTGSGRVLLVEDEDVVRSFAVRALKSRGYEVLEAASGVEALEVMAQCNGEVDIVVSDVVMPEMDGPTLLKRLRAQNPEIRIIFVSGYPNEAFKQQLDENEAFAFLPKPFSLPQLAAKVKEELGR